MIIDKAYRAYDDLCILFTLNPMEMLPKGSRFCNRILEGRRDWERIVEKFENLSLQMASFTITEKGYEDIRKWRACKDCKAMLPPLPKRQVSNKPC